MFQLIAQAGLAAGRLLRPWKHAEPSIVDAQYRIITRQVPLTYSLLIGNTWTLALQFSSAAPHYLWLYIPLLLTVGSGIRMVAWWRIGKTDVATSDARRYLRRTSYAALLIALIILLWGRLLFNYGTVYTNGLIAFYLALSMMGCAAFMTHLFSVAIALSAMGSISFALIFGATGNSTFVAMTVILSLVTLATTTMYVMNHLDFTRMIIAQRRTSALSEENRRLADLDPLTQLPNRRHFFAKLHAAFVAATRKGQPLSVGILDLDGFKAVNDLFGHIAGDDILKQVAARITGLWSDRAHIARLGGDQFALIVPQLDEDALRCLGRETCAVLSSPYSVRANTVRVRASIGFASYPQLAEDEKSLFELANYALYRGKRAGGGFANMFSVDQRAEMLRDAEVIRALHSANLNDELYMEFQPIVDIRMNRIVALEALARWASPQLGTVSPGVFIPAAEQSGMISNLTVVLLKQALHVASCWPDHLRLSFNISAADICSPEALSRLTAIVSGGPFDPRRLDFEITETAMVRDVVQTAAALRTLKDLGCGISLDDFGTGFSSLSQLHALPLTKIKVDRSFVTNLHTRSNSYKIVKSLLALSHDMQLACIVEGVETHAELLALQTLGCDLVQGYIFSKPLPWQLAMQAVRDDTLHNERTRSRQVSG